MTDLDRVAALSTVAARLEIVGERVTMHRVPVSIITELHSIQQAVEAILASYDPGAGDETGGEARP